MPRFVKGRSYMNDPDLVAHEALRWLRFSEEDLSVALRLLSGSPSAPRHACWLSQQAAEKALKAVLVLEEVEFPFTHDLAGITHIKLPGSKQGTILDESHRSITHGCRQPSNQAHRTILSAW